jgi:hypothetical protein
LAPTLNGVRTAKSVGSRADDFDSSLLENRPAVHQSSLGLLCQHQMSAQGRALAPPAPHKLPTAEKFKFS